MISLWLLGLVPVSLALGYGFDAPAPIVFGAAAIAIIPLADWIRRATEQLAASSGAAIGGLLNVTLGNAAELIIAFFVLREGHAEVVKAQITGAIIGNSLLGLGLSIVVGSIGREKQTFNLASASRLGTLLILSVFALLLPAIFDLTERGVFASVDVSALDRRLSVGVAVVLILVYLANLAYSLITHRDIFAAAEDEAAHAEPATWSVGRSLAVLAGATAVAAVESELLASALESTAESLHLSTFFLGITVLAVVGNAAEYFAAVYFARRNRMDLVIGITLGSTIQIALLVAPILVLVSGLLGAPMDLVFTNPLELIAIAAAAFVVDAIASDGETTWFEGVMLLAVYVLLGLAFLMATPPA